MFEYNRRFPFSKIHYKVLLDNWISLSSYKLDI